MKLPQVSGKEVLKALLRQGFEKKGGKGSHVNLIKETPGKTFHVTIPIHANRDLNPTVIKSIMRQSGYSLEEFTKIL